MLHIISSAATRGQVGDGKLFPQAMYMSKITFLTAVRGWVGNWKLFPQVMYIIMLHIISSAATRGQVGDGKLFLQAMYMSKITFLTAVRGDGKIISTGYVYTCALFPLLPPEGRFVVVNYFHRLSIHIAHYLPRCHQRAGWWWETISTG